MKKENRKLAHHGCNVAEFLQNVSTLCLSVYDTRRGTKEGQEADKVLCFHPEWTSTNVRTSLVGLAQALTSFSSSFGADESSEHVMDAKHHRWVLVQCEPHIWLLMVAKKTWLGGTCCDLTLRHFLRMVHAQHLLLQGPIACTLEQDPSGSMAHRVLQPLVSEMGARLSCADSLEAAGLSNPLGQISTHMPLLPTPTPAFLSVQCLVSALLQLLPPPQSARATHPAHPPSKHPSTLRGPGSTSPSKHTHPSSPLPSLQGPCTSAFGWAGFRKQAVEASLPLQGAMVLWYGRPVWSTLAVQDGVAVYHFAQRALLPHVEGGKRCTKLLRSLAFTAALDCQASASAATAQEQEQAGPQEQPYDSATHAGAAAVGVDASQGGGSTPSASSSFLPASSAPAAVAAKLPTRGRTGTHPPTICHACYDTLLSPNRWGVVEFLEACRTRSSSSSSSSSSSGSASTRNKEGGVGAPCAAPKAATPPPPPQAQTHVQAQAPQGKQSGPGTGSYSKAGLTAAAAAAQARAPAPAPQAGKEGVGEGAGGAESCEAHTPGAQKRGSDPAEPKPAFLGSEHAVSGNSGSNGGGGSDNGGSGNSDGGGNTGGDRGVGNTSNSSAGGLNVGGGGLSSFKDMMANASAQASTAFGSAATTFSTLMGTSSLAPPAPSSAPSSASSLGTATPQPPNPSHQQRQSPAQPAQQRLRQHPPQHHREHHLSGFLCPCLPPAGLRTHAVFSTGGASQASALPPHALPLETAASVDELGGLRDGVASGAQGTAAPAVSVGREGAEQQGGVMAARVWMQGMQRHCVLLPAFRGPLLVLMLLQTDHQNVPRAANGGSASAPNTVAVSPECLQAIVEVLAQHVPPTSGRLAAGVPAQDLWHCPGFRYCHEDDACAATRCTPAEKVPTLSSSALKLTAYVRDRLQHLEHTARLQGGGGSEGAAQEVCDSTLDELDFMCRTGQGSWITARHAAARQTLVTLEAHAPTSLAEAAAQVHKLYDTVARGFYAGLG